MSYETEFFQALSEPLDAVNLRRIFLLLMQFHYSDTGNYGKDRDRIGGVVFNDNPGKDPAPRLNIELSHIFVPDKQAAQTSILVSFGAFDFAKKVIDNVESHSEDNSSCTYVSQCSTVLKLMHVAATADQALLFGQQSTAFLMGVRPMLMQRLGLAAFDIVKLTDPVPWSEMPERYFRADLQCSLTFNFALTTNIESHRIKKFAMTLEPA